MFGGKKWREIIELDIFNIETTYINTVMKLHWKENGGPIQSERGLYVRTKNH